MAARRGTTARRPASRKRTTKRRTAPAAAAAQLPKVGVGERLWVLDVPYEDRGLIGGHGAVWHPGVKATIWVGARLPAGLVHYQSRAYTWPRLLEDTLNGGRPGPPMTGVAPMRPYPLQIDGARAIAQHAAAGRSQFFLADEPGVGKTISCIIGAKAAAKLRGGTRILVVADRPAQITIGHWCRSIAAVGDGGFTWCVTTWDRLEQVAGNPWAVIVADEAQMVRHQTTKRWKRFLALSGFARKTRRPYVIAATATPAHSPLEMPWLAGAFADRHGTTAAVWVEDLGAAMAARGVHVVKGRYGWEWTDDAQHRAGDMRMIRGWLENQQPPAMLYRAAPQGSAPIHGMPVDLTPAEWLRYQAEWGEFCAEMNLARRGNNVARGRAAVLRFRQKAGLIRVRATGEWAAQQVEAGRQVAISVQYVETAADPIVDWLEAHKVPVARIYGQGRFNQETERLRFQTGRAPVVVFTPAASLSLHAGEQLSDGSRATTLPRVGVFHQARYSGIQGRQIVGRIHRDNQVAPWWVTYADGTVEAQVAKVMIERYAATAAAVGGDNTAVTAIARMLNADWLPESALASDD